MDKAVVITAQIDKVAITAINHVFSSASLKEAVNSLEEYTPGEIRGYLVESGLIGNMLKLREVVEASLAMTGGEDHSAIITVLLPSEISRITKISPEIFSEDKFDLIKPCDYNDPSKWERLSKKEYESIFESNDQKIIRRITGGKDGPWAIYKNDVNISPEAVNSYFTAICNAERTDEWKTQSIKAIGLNLLAYASRFIDSIYVRCLDEFPDIAESISEIMAKGTAWQDASASHLTCVKRLEKELTAKNMIVSSDNLVDMINELRSFGINEPTVEDIKDALEFKPFEELLTKGIPG